MYYIAREFSTKISRRFPWLIPGLQGLIQLPKWATGRYFLHAVQKPTHLNRLLCSYPAPVHIQLDKSFHFYEACKKWPVEWSCDGRWWTMTRSMESSAQRRALSTITNQLSINTSSVKANSFGSGQSLALIPSWAGTTHCDFRPVVFHYIACNFRVVKATRTVLLSSSGVQVRSRCHGCWQPCQQICQLRAWLTRHCKAASNCTIEAADNARVIILLSYRLSSYF